MCQSSANPGSVHSVWNTLPIHPQGSFLPFFSGPHSKVTLAIGFPCTPYLNGTPIPLPSILITFFKMNKKRWRKDMGSRRFLDLTISQFNIIIRIVCSCQGSILALQACGGMTLAFPPEASLWHIKKKSDFYICLANRHTMKAFKWKAWSLSFQ